MARRGIPEDVAAINAEIRRFFDQEVSPAKRLRNWFGVYAFYDYDTEPIYVGQTEEGLGARIRRHMTNQRTDAVAMNVLDPFEVAYIEVWPLAYPPIPKKDKAAFESHLSQCEYTVFQKVLSESRLGAVLNEKDIPGAQLVALPASYRRCIIPESIQQARSHPDIRIARRALTIARLAQVISERDVSTGLRRTLLTQARRLERLASSRLAEFGDTVPVEEFGEETGETSPE
ncbi:MAG TPA: GIY-YIG nuclease family protein [Fimbriimonadaceae bacterium]|nr:GIY-YIG nuclease family protein [Fimbriimonadaceae bacterium]